MSLRDKMLAVMADVNSAVAEREELVELIAIALLTRKNLFILGDPGQAKSYAINAFRSRITGAKQFERLLSKQTEEEQLFGRLDLSSLIPGSVPESAFEGDSIYQNLRFDLQSFLNGLPKMKSETATFDKLAEVSGKLDAYRKAVAALHPCEPVVQTAGKIPEADIVFLDEIFKCNDGVLNALLTALNERKYTNEGRTYPIPTISFFAASNEIPNFNDPEEKILAALYDRLELKVVTENISEKAHRLAILKDKLGGSFGAVHATISLEELRAMQQEVSSIKVSDKIHDLMDDVLCALRAQIPVSDRKFLSYFSIAQAKAWLEGHTEVTSTDLLVLRNYFWQQPSDREFVTGTLERLCINPMQERSTIFLLWHRTQRTISTAPAVRRKTSARSRLRSANSAVSWYGSTRCRPRWLQMLRLTAKKRLRTGCSPSWNASARRHMRPLDSPIRRWSSWQHCSNDWEVYVGKSHQNHGDDAGNAHFFQERNMRAVYGDPRYAVFVG